MVKVFGKRRYFFGKFYKLYGSFTQNLQKKYNIYLTNMPLNGTITHDGREAADQHEKRGDEDI